jgi:hypothetical protein
MVLNETTEMDEQHKVFRVVHPLDDIPEEKLDTERLQPMRMTRGVRYSLFALRGYLILMIVLVLFHVLNLAHLF